MNTEPVHHPVRRWLTGLPGPDRWRLSEGHRRLAYLWVTALAGVTQLLSTAVQVGAQAGPPVWWPVAGGALCLTAWALLWSGRLPCRWVDYGILVGASVLVGTQLFLPGGPLTTDHLFGCVFLILASFSILPLLAAGAYVTGVLGAVGAALLLHGGPAHLFWNVALAGVLAAHVSTFGRNVSIQRAEARAFETLANTDLLTGLANRRATLARAEAAFASPTATLMLLDVDRFKRINDRFGHDVGDQVLRDLGGCLTRVVGRAGHVGRWGGEEFLVVTDRDPLEVSAELLACVRRDVTCGGGPVTISLGGARRSEVESVQEWLRLADARLYEAKEAGRDRAEFHRPDLWEVLGATLSGTDNRQAAGGVRGPAGQRTGDTVGAPPAVGRADARP